MSIEDRLRHELRERAGAVEPSRPEWAHVASRLRPDRPSDRRWRSLLLAVATACAVVAGLVTAVALNRGTGHRVRVASTPGTTVSPSAGVPGPDPGTAAPLSTVPPPPAALIGPAGGPVPPGFDPVSVTWISVNQGWVLGTAPCTHPPCTSLLRTRDGGRTWRGVPAPKIALSATGDGGWVRFADGANGWVFGPDLWATHDGGATWSVVVVRPGRGIVRLEAASGRVYALVAPPAGPAQLFSSPTGKDDWRPLGSQVVQGAILTLHGTTGYTMGAGGAVLAFSAVGVETRGQPCPGSSIPHLSAGAGAGAGAGSLVAAVCTAGAALGSSDKTLVVSGDGGRSWSVAGTAPFGGEPGELAEASAGTYLLAANSGATELYRSADGGRTWSTAYSDNSTGGAPLRDLGFTTPARGTVIQTAPGGGRSTLLVTTDGGATWQANRLGS